MGGVNVKKALGMPKILWTDTTGLVWLQFKHVFRRRSPYPQLKAIADRVDTHPDLQVVYYKQLDQELNLDDVDDDRLRSVSVVQFNDILVSMKIPKSERQLIISWFWGREAKGIKKVWQNYKIKRNLDQTTEMMLSSVIELQKFNAENGGKESKRGSSSDDKARP